MENKKKRIYSYLIKKKIFSFSLFFSMAIIIYFLSLFYKNIPILVSFIMICILYAIRNYSNFIYLAYLYKISSLPEKDLEEESKGASFLVLLSFPIIFITGMLMSLLLSSPNSEAGFVQIFLLFSFFIILDEFFIDYKIGKFQKNALNKNYSKIKGQTHLNFIVLLIMENIGAIFTLVDIALRLKFPINILSLFSLLIIIGIMTNLFFKIIKKSEHID